MQQVRGISTSENQAIYQNLQIEYDNLVNEFECNGYENVLENLSNANFSENEIENAMKLMSKISKVSNSMRELSDNSISAIMQDSLMNINDLKSWYQIVRTPIAKYLLAETHFFTNDYEQADAVLKEIPEMFNFGKHEKTEHENYLQFHNLKKQLQLSERTWADLKDDEISYLQTVAEANTGRSSTMAKGVLCFFFNICYKDNYETDMPIEEPKLNPKSTFSVPEKVIYSSEDIINEDIEKVEVYDMTGRLVYQIKDNKKIDFTGLPAGIYIAKVYGKKLQVTSYKLRIN